MGLRQSVLGFSVVVGLLLGTGTGWSQESSEEAVPPAEGSEPVVTAPETEVVEGTVPAEEAVPEAAAEGQPEAEAVAAATAESETGSPDSSGQIGIPAGLVPDAVGSGGAFTQRVEIAIPAFRDLPGSVAQIG